MSQFDGYILYVVFLYSICCLVIDQLTQILDALWLKVYFATIVRWANLKKMILKRHPCLFLTMSSSIELVVACGSPHEIIIRDFVFQISVRPMNNNPLVKKLSFLIEDCSGSSPDNTVQELLVHNQFSTGWVSEKFCSFPQHISIRLQGGIHRILKIQILLHHYKIPTKIELSISPYETDQLQKLG